MFGLALHPLFWLASTAATSSAAMPQTCELEIAGGFFVIDCQGGPSPGALLHNASPDSPLAWYAVSHCSTGTGPSGVIDPDGLAWVPYFGPSCTDVGCGHNSCAIDFFAPGCVNSPTTVNFDVINDFQSVSPAAIAIDCSGGASSQIVTLSNCCSAGAWPWTASSDCAYVTVSAPSGIVAPGGAMNVSIVVNCAQANCTQTCHVTFGGIHDPPCEQIFSSCTLEVRTSPAPTRYCTAGTSTNGCTPVLWSSGVASASAGSGFTLITSQLEGQRISYVFFGVTGAQATPWGNGTSFMCIVAPRQRTSNQLSSGTSGLCDGTIGLDWNNYVASHPNAIGQPFQAGDVVWAQTWYRDPPAPKTTNLSSALTFTLCP